MPLASLKFPPESKMECGTCHGQQVKELTENQSKHALRTCAFCHDRHGFIPDCSKCHKPHVQGQVMTDCLACHPVHHPKQIQPPEKTPVAFCAPCHGQVAANLGKTQTKHGQLLCVYCHKGQHPSVPKCQDCHGLPHGALIHKNMPLCVNCHMDPHLLVK